MSSGGVLQLVAYGAQDIYLTSEPQTTFFKSVYRRHSNFSKECIEIPINGIIKEEELLSVNISRSGDLLKQLWIYFNPSELIPKNGNNSTNVQALADNIGHALFEYIDIEIGGTIIDRHYGKWLTIWRDLTQINPYGWSGSYNEPVFIHGLISNVDTVFPLIFEDGEEPQSYITYIQKLADFGPTQKVLTVYKSNGEDLYINSNGFKTGMYTTKYDTLSYNHRGITKNVLTQYGDTTNKLNISTKNAPTEAYVPLKFWFSKNPGLALPIIALQYHEVVLKLKLAKRSDWVKATDPSIGITTNLSSIRIFGDYIYLDSSERKQFVQNSHEYLIEQVQLQSINTKISNVNNCSFDVSFNHPVKEIIFSGTPIEIQDLDYTHPMSPVGGGASPNYIVSRLSYSTGTFGNNMSSTDCNLTITFNGTERFSPRNLKYFTRNQVNEYHKGSSGNSYAKDTIGVYSFSIDPEEIQPSGSCNFSRLDKVSFNFTNINTSTERLNPIDVYAINYNILRIMSGMGGLTYSN